MSDEAYLKCVEDSLKLFKHSFIEKKNLFINFPATQFKKGELFKIIELIIIFLSKVQKERNLPFKVGDRYQDKKEGETYQIAQVETSNLVLKKVKTNPKIEQEYKRTILYKNFTDIFIKVENNETRLNNQKLLCYRNSFEKFLGSAPPSEYHHKAVVITSKEYFEKIRQLLLPIARIRHDGTLQNPSKVDPPIYFTSNWHTALNHIKKEQKQIEIVFIFDKVIPTDILSQIIRDQKIHQFTLSGCISQIKSTEYLKEIMQWNWFKEELEESLNYV